MRNLHTADKRPQWDKIPEPRHNYFQRIARKTNGLATPANIVTVVGFSLVMSGLMDLVRDNRGRAIVKIAAGRSLDLVDGMVANATGTISPVGEALDAGLDKVAMLAAIATFHKTGSMAPSIKKLFIARDIGMATLTLIGKARQTNPHPTEAGKTATFHQWMATSSMLIAAELRNSDLPELANGAEVAAAAFTGLFIARSAEGLVGQAQLAFAPSVIEA